VNPERLKELLENPDTATTEDIPALEELVSAYPYFQAAKVLLAKISGTSEAIKSAAVVTADRSILMRVINGTFDKDIRLPNLNDLDIGTEVNAFEHLSSEDKEEQLVEDSTENDASFDKNIDALLNTFEKEVDQEEVDKEGTSELTSEDKEEESKSLFKDSELSDLSTDDYKLPDYSYNFDSENEKLATDEEDTGIISSNESSLLDKDNDDDSEDNFEDFQLKDISSENENTEEQTADSVNDDDVFRNELMESLADLERIRKENSIDEESKTSEEENHEDLNREDNTSTYEQTQITTHQNLEETPTEDSVEIKINEDEQNKIEYEQKHVIESLKKTETISDSNPMFDDNLFELNHLIDKTKQKNIKLEQEEDINGQKEVIDRFINTIPELTAQDHESREYSHLARDLYDRSVHADTSKMTETMAKLMITQGKLPRAIEIYEHLMLKYPEKKAYFADQIEKLNSEH